MYVFVCACYPLRGVYYLRAEGNLLGDVQGGKRRERNKKDWSFYFA